MRANADTLSETLIEGGLDVLTGGTDTHLLQLDLRKTEWTGKDAEERLDEVKLTVNRNTVPFDERPPTVASGVRIGTPAATMRGFAEDDFREVGSVIVEALGESADIQALAARSGRALRQASAVPGVPRVHGIRHVSAVATERLIEVKHPLVQHKLVVPAGEDTPTVHFRKIANEVTLLLTYEATKDFPTEDVEIETPWRRRRSSGSPARRSPSVRSSGPASECSTASSRSISGARVGFIGLYRDEETLEPVEYYVKLPTDLAERDVIVLDPMLATGNSSAAAIAKVKEAGARTVTLVSLVAAPEGIERIHAEHPDVRIVTASVDRGLNERGYIVPGLGDAGDRLYGTK